MSSVGVRIAKVLPRATKVAKTQEWRLTGELLRGSEMFPTSSSEENPKRFANEMDVPLVKGEMIFLEVPYYGLPSIAVPNLHL